MKVSCTLGQRTVNLDIKKQSVEIMLKEAIEQLIEKQNALLPKKGQRICVLFDFGTMEEYQTVRRKSDGVVQFSKMDKNAYLRQLQEQAA